MTISELKNLQATYVGLVRAIRVFIDESRPSSRTTSPTVFNIPRPMSRMRSNTNPLPPTSGQNQRQLDTTLRAIESKYRLSWECAELLVDLGGGGTSATPTLPEASPSAMDAKPTQVDGRKSRERAVTLAGDEPKPIIISPSTSADSATQVQWRASTGRHDLSQRQLSLLRDMLHNPDSTTFMAFQGSIPEDQKINRDWRWGNAMSSTVTLPSEESIQGAALNTNSAKKRRVSRIGMRGLRDMLRLLKKSYSEEPCDNSTPIPPSSMSVSASTDSSLNIAELRHAQPISQRGRSKTSIGPESVTAGGGPHSNSPYITSVSLQHRSSPRRPSLASIFRFGQKSRSHAAPGKTVIANASQGALSSSNSLGTHSMNGGDFEDWDAVDRESDLDHTSQNPRLPSDGASTIKGKHSVYIVQRSRKAAPNFSQSSLSIPDSTALGKDHSLGHSRSMRFSNVIELPSHIIRPSSRGKQSPTPSLRHVGNHKDILVESVRSAPSSWSTHNANIAYGVEAGSDPKLSMSPENIGPLLENARDVHARCSECIAELNTLLVAASSM